MDMRQFFSKTSPSGIIATGLILVILVGLLDYETGSQVSLSIFYLLPITLVTWFSTTRIGALIAVISAVTWLIADLTTGTVYTYPLIPYWNAILRFFGNASNYFTSRGKRQIAPILGFVEVFISLAWFLLFPVPTASLP